MSVKVETQAELVGQQTFRDQDSPSLFLVSLEQVDLPALRHGQLAKVDLLFGHHPSRRLVVGLVAVHVAHQMRRHLL